MRIRSARLAAAATILAAHSAAPAQPAVPLNEAWSVEGRLDADDPRDADQRSYEEHRIRLPEGERFQLSAASEDFDTVLQLYRPGEREPFAENDDGGEGFNSRLSFTPKAGGDYVVRVLGFGPDAAGSYRLSAEALPPLPPPITVAPARTEAMLWRVYPGTLAAGDAEYDGKRVDDYSFSFRSGEEVLIRVGSEEFDTIVHILRADGRDAEPVATDDDSGGDLNSLLVFRPEETAGYVVRVTAFQAGAGGAYTLRIGR